MPPLSSTPIYFGKFVVTPAVRIKCTNLTLILTKPGIPSDDSVDGFRKSKTFAARTRAGISQTDNP